MVRWARSKGSAGSNERTEEEATPWSQLVAGMRRNAAAAAESNVEDLEDESNGHQYLSDDTNDVQDNVHREARKDDAATARKSSDEAEKDEEEEEEEEVERVDDILNEGSKEKKKVVLVEQSEEVDGDKSKKKKKKRSQDKCLNCKQKGHLKKECPDLTEERRKELQELYTMKIERKGHGTGRKKNKRKAAESLENGTDKDNKERGGDGDDGAKESSATDSSSPAKKPKMMDGGQKKGQNHHEGGQKKGHHHHEGGQKGRNQRPPKKPLLDITGQTVQEDEGLFQGFRVKKEAVKKLKALATQLKTEERPETEIAETLKRERRKAERELAKFRKMVCFNCRQSGHLLIDCPQQQKKENNGTANESSSSMLPSNGNHCFKCGSKDHTSRDCVSKRKGKDAYAFATCFICKETGHLAKSCPDNPRGLYPKGGGCRFCGSVEHLKADCSRKIQKDERLEVKVGVISAGNDGGYGLEDIVDDRQDSGKKTVEKPQKKVVKF